MEDVNKVFYSEITRDDLQLSNNLYDLYDKTSAIPMVVENIDKDLTCNFIPKIDKTYIPKRLPKINKVKTVRDIRASFESDIYAYLTKDLETQQNCILKLIRRGCSKDDKTVQMVKKVLKADFPVSKPAWEMIANINPENHMHNRQFVLWNKKLIQVNGSTGGKNKLICNYDLTTKLSKIGKRIVNTNISRKKKGLLQNSLDVRFKPGPLGKKKLLDNSYQKCNGDIELVDIPRVGLEIQPTYGKTLDPTIMPFLNSFRKSDGTMSQKWAEFAVSVLGKIEKPNAKLLNKECLTFELNYKCDQHRILMRKDFDSTDTTGNQIMSFNKNCVKDQLTTFSEIKYMMSKMLDAVEVSIEQDNMFATDDDFLKVVSENTQNNTNIVKCTREKPKRKYNELDRLDVTVIRLPSNSKKVQGEDCGNSFCILGCVCDSLNTTLNIKQHCGRLECMFECKCDFSKYTTANSFDEDGSEWIAAVIGIENKINTRLAKEEQKFRQTVIMTDEKNILLKSVRRNWKASKKYDNFYKNMCLKKVPVRKPLLSVTALKINCDNIEPWCMVHNLYKCFCKGKMTESSIAIPNISTKSLPAITNIDYDYSSNKNQKLVDTTTLSPKYLRPRVKTDESSSGKPIQEKCSVVDKSSTVKNYNIPKTSKSGGICNEEEKEHNGHDEDIASSENNDVNKLNHSYDNRICARLIPYLERKYSDGYYRNINVKIKEMEQNDRTLHQRMMNLFKSDSQIGKKKETSATQNHPENTPTANPQVLTNNQSSDPEDTESENLGQKSSDNPNTVEFFYDTDGTTSNNQDKSNKKLLFRENKLITWLESNYKLYKKRIDKGLTKTTLERPKLGKIALHSWDFILSRYRERKNLFLISKQPPYRIFLGVNTKSPFFQNCMNIDEIRYADIHKYPHTVQNLLTNATNLKDNFCILRGSAYCWELCGSVAKVNSTEINETEIADENSDLETNFQYENNEKINEQLLLRTPNPKDMRQYTLEDINCRNEKEHSKEGDSSKWFVMTVENDFDEIRFYKKGFFVKYTSILKATDVARVTGKTVRLSSQKCGVLLNGPQFGVYAIPNASEYCVFIGPYELQECLGIETVKTMSNLKTTLKTRGFWITTNKVDNFKVIDNPLSFMTLTNMEEKTDILLENNLKAEKQLQIISTSEKSYSEDSDTTPQKALSIISTIKKIKTITIPKPKRVYKVTRTGLLKGVIKSPVKQYTYSPVLNSNLRIGFNNVKKRILNDTFPKGIQEDEQIMSPTVDDLCAQNDLQPKITSVYSQISEDEQPIPKKGSMFVLKPEEINRKVMAETSAHTYHFNNDDETSKLAAMDVDTDTACSLNSDILVISDDEDYETGDRDSSNSQISENWNDVLIQCTCVSDLVCIRGRQRPDSRLLSFKLPDEGFSDFCPEPDAFRQLNKELSAKVGAKKPFKLSWKVINSKDEKCIENTPKDLGFWRGLSPNSGDEQDDEMEITPLDDHDRMAKKPKLEIENFVKGSSE